MNTKPAQWQDVLTDQNPADLCTRGTTSKELSDCALRWNGPEWLLDYRDKWPKIGLDNRPNDLPEKKTANKRNESDQSVAVKTCHHQRLALERKGSEILRTLTGDLILDDIPVGSIWSEYTQECREL